MLTQIFATKMAMAQVWTKDGKRLPVTKCKIEPNQVIATRAIKVQAINPAGQRELVPCQIAEIGFGNKKITRMTKPLRDQLTQAGFTTGVKQIRGLRELGETASVTAGSTLNSAEILQVGDVVAVQGVSKGKGYQGVMKRWGFHGGPATHGQSDRKRAPGSIGQRTQPGRVHKGHHMAGHMGDAVVTVGGLTVLHLDPATQEVWLSGPIPGANRGIVRLSKTGTTKKVELDLKASGIAAAATPAAPASEASASEAPTSKTLAPNQTSSESEDEATPSTPASEAEVAASATADDSQAQES